LERNGNRTIGIPLNTQDCWRYGSEADCKWIAVRVNAIHIMHQQSERICISRSARDNVPTRMCVKNRLANIETFTIGHVARTVIVRDLNSCILVHEDKSEIRSGGRLVEIVRWFIQDSGMKSDGPGSVAGDPGEWRYRKPKDIKLNPDLE